MANDFVKQYEAPIDFTFGLFEKFLVLCPEHIWQEKFGGWPVSLQYYHALAATGMMIASIGGIRAENPNPKASDLGDSLDNLPTTDEARTFLASLKRALDATIEKLTDQDLLKKDEPLSEKFGRDVTVAETLELIACHMQYHLGACDGALRATGLAAAF